jgi:hypothetical protein
MQTKYQLIKVWMGDVINLHSIPIQKRQPAARFVFHKIDHWFIFIQTVTFATETTEKFRYFAP